MYVRFGAFVEGVERFDSGAFRLPYAEAAALDPQARILLEQTHVSVPRLGGRVTMEEVSHAAGSDFQYWDCCHSRIGCTKHLYGGGRVRRFPNHIRFWKCF